MDDLPPIRKRTGRSLPHWTREGAPNYMTMRLDDALPAALMQAYHEEIRERTCGDGAPDGWSGALMRATANASCDFPRLPGWSGTPSGGTPTSGTGWTPGA